MPTLDGDIGNLIKCDRCGTIVDWKKLPKKEYEEVFNIKFELWGEIFKGRPQPKEAIFSETCLPCTKAMTPRIWALRDADELRYYVNNLRRAINEKTQDNRRSARDASGDNHASDRR